MRDTTRQAMLFTGICLFSLIMLKAFSMPFIFFREKAIVLIVYAVVVGYLIFGSKASKKMRSYKKAGYCLVLLSSFLMMFAIGVGNFFKPIYTRKFIDLKIYYIVGNPGYNNDWDVQLVEYNLLDKKVVETYYIHGLYEPKLSIEKRGSELYIKETKQY